MPTVRQQRALGRADQDFGSGCSPFDYCYELSRCLWPVCYCRRAPRTTTSRAHRRVERAATVAFSRLFVQSPCCKTRGPRQPHYTRRLSFLGRFGRFGLGGWLFEASGFESTYQMATRQSSPIAERHKSNCCCNRCFTARASVRTDSARRESYQQRSTTAKTQALRRAATKVAS